MVRRVSIVISVATNNGINLREISNEIRSTIINYISSLGVGDDVVLSDIIVRVKSINGVNIIPIKPKIYSNIIINNKYKLKLYYINLVYILLFL